MGRLAGSTAACYIKADGERGCSNYVLINPIKPLLKAIESVSLGY